MKQTTLITTLMLFAAFLFAQSTSPQVIASSGSFTENGNISLSTTVGETATATLSVNTTTLTQGFQQPDPSDAFVSADKLSPVDFQIKVFPNPATDYLRVEWKTNKQHEVYAELYDLVGRKIIRIKSDESTDHIQINMQAFQRSAYLLKVYTKDRKYFRTFRIVKL